MEPMRKDRRGSAAGRSCLRSVPFLGFLFYLSTSASGSLAFAGADQSWLEIANPPLLAIAGTTLEYALILSVFSLVLVGTILALICTRLLYLRKRTQGGQVVTFDDLLRDKLDRHSAELKNLVEDHKKQLVTWEEQTKTAREKADATAKEAFETTQKLTEQLSSQLQANVTRGHEVLGKEFQQIAQDMAATREMLSTIRKVAEEKKEELELYKKGLRHTYAKDTLNHLCDARESLWYLKELASENSPETTARLIKAFTDIDFELGDKLDLCDLVEIPVKSGMSIYEPEFSGRYRILDKTPSPSPELVNTVCRIKKPGYMKRVQMDGEEKLEIFRPVGLNVYFDPSEGASDEPLQQSPAS